MHQLYGRQCTEMVIRSELPDIIRTGTWLRGGRGSGTRRGAARPPHPEHVAGSAPRAGGRWPRGRASSSGLPASSHSLGLVRSPNAGYTYSDCMSRKVCSWPKQWSGPERRTSRVVFGASVSSSASIPPGGRRRKGLRTGQEAFKNHGGVRYGFTRRRRFPHSSPLPRPPACPPATGSSNTWPGLPPPRRLDAPRRWC